MIKTWLITGDTHGDTAKYSCFKSYPNPEEVAMIVLGDVGFNYELNYNDNIRKKRASKYGGYIYCVRGNHEARPKDVKGMQKIFDENVSNFVYYEPDFPLIRYFIDGNLYNIGGCTALVLGGAYSVDKEFRIKTGRKWFENEQLNKKEMDNIFNVRKNSKVDIILSHTCPYSWQPKDLFLDCIDQSTVDTSTELWLEKIKNNTNWDYWFFGHYHDDRLVRPRVEMFYDCIEELDDVLAQWDRPEIIRYMKKDPNYFMD